MTIMIPRNTAFPTIKHHLFTTSEDNQTSFPIKIFEGENSRASDNIYLGHFVLDGLRPNEKKGVPQIEVTFDIDGNRNLKVSALERSTGKIKMAVINQDWVEKINTMEVSGPSEFGKLMEAIGGRLAMLQEINIAIYKKEMP